MKAGDLHGARLTQAFIHLDRMTRNLRRLQSEVGGRLLWPCIKGNAYGHDAEICARHLTGIGFNTLGVADAGEAVALAEAGVDATFIILSEMLPESSELIVARGFEPAISTLEMAEALARHADRPGRRIRVHLKVDTGMGRLGIRPEAVPAFIDRCQHLPAEPVLELKTRVTFLKEVPAGTGLSYGHEFHTQRPALIATVAISYGDGLSRRFSNNLDVLVPGTRWAQRHSGLVRPIGRQRLRSGSAVAAPNRIWNSAGNEENSGTILRTESGE